MADKKISALTSATTPLAGTEVLPIVQSGSTVKVAISDLTAGRAVATGALTVTGAATVSTTLGVTGATTLSSTLSLGGTVSGGGNQINNVIIGTTTPLAGAFTTLSATGTTTSGNGVGNALLILNGQAANSRAILGQTVGTNRWIMYLGNPTAESGSSAGSDFQLLAISDAGSGIDTPILITRASGGAIALGGTSSRPVTATGTLSGGTSGTGYSFSGSAPANSLALDSSGNLGIGTASPAYKLDVSAGSGTGIRLKSTGAYGNFRADNTGTTGGGVFSAYQNGVQITIFGVDGAVLGNTSTDTAIFNDVVGGGIKLYTNASATPKATLDSSGNLGVGTSSPAFKTEIVGGADTVETTLLQLRSNFGGTGTGSTIAFRNTTSSTGDSGGVQLAAIRDTASGGSFVIRTADSSGTIQNRVKISETGQFAIGTTTSVSGNTNLKFVVKSTGSSDACEVQATTNGALGFDFRNASGTQVGTIAINSATTTYNTSSDYRLKNTIAPMMGALAKVELLKPCTYKWNADGSDGQGFIAHELAEVCPYAVTGAKDALDANGNIKPQGIDVSFLVATLTAAIQEQQALITQLTARITALETT